MERVLIEFVDTLDTLMKQTIAEIGDGTGLTKLTLHQFQYIEAIHALGEPTITEIAERLGITKASVTAGVNKLIELGYVTKSQSSQDKRVFHVRLTRASASMIQAKLKVVKGYGAFIRAALTEAEARQFEATLEKLVQAFHETRPNFSKASPEPQGDAPC